MTSDNHNVRIDFLYNNEMSDLWLRGLLDFSIAVVISACLSLRSSTRLLFGFEIPVQVCSRSLHHIKDMMPQVLFRRRGRIVSPGRYPAFIYTP